MTTERDLLSRLQTKAMTRFKASAFHFLISASVVSVIFALIFLIWYPPPTFLIAGSFSIVLLLVGAGLILGPLLTLIVYRQDKPGLRFDLGVIATIQLAALVYGMFALFQERPYYMVFVVDRINIVAEKSIDKSKLRFDELQQKPFANLIRVFARMPEGDEFQAFLKGVIFEGLPDMELRPEYWEPYSAGNEIIRNRIRPLSELNSVTELDKRRVQEVIERHSAEHPRLGYLPIASLDKDVGMIMDMDTAEPIDYIRVDPW
jgi:uncharacterized membrane protein